MPFVGKDGITGAGPNSNNPLVGKEGTAGAGPNSNFPSVGTIGAGPNLNSPSNFTGVTLIVGTVISGGIIEITGGMKLIGSISNFGIII